MRRMIPRWQLVLLASVAALAPFDVKFGSDPWTDLQLRPLLVLALVGSAVLIGASLRDRAARRISLAEAAVVFWLVGLWLSVITSDLPRLGAATAARISVVGLVAIAAARTVKSRDDARTLLTALAWGVSLAAGYGLLVWASGAEWLGSQHFVGRITRLGPWNRLTRPWGHANIAAMVLGAGLFWPVAWRNRFAGIAGAGLVTVALMLTVSRGGLIAAGGAMLAWIALRRRQTDVLLVAVLVATAAVTFVASDGWRARAVHSNDLAFYAAEVEAPTLIELDGAGDAAPAVLDARVVVTNESAIEWQSDLVPPIEISARWLGPDGQVWTEQRWPLAESLAAGRSRALTVPIDVRVPDGSYQVRWDLVIQDEAYFRQFVGLDPVWSAASVTGSPFALERHRPYPFVSRALGLTRTEIWQQGWDAFTSAPLLGVGPGQLGAFSAQSPAGSSIVPGGHAHNVVLEPLATWGLIPTIPFLAFYLVTSVAAVITAWTSRDWLAAVVAVGFVAAGLHGLVDWPLPHTGMAIPLGAIIGLTWCRPFWLTTRADADVAVET